MRYRRDLKWFAAVSTLTIGPSVLEYTPCAYCGLPATSTDHVTALSFVQDLKDVTSLPDWRLRMVPACHECNGLAGNSVFKTVAEKRKFIQAKLRKRYQKILRIPSWDKDDLQELSLELVQYVKHGLSLREIILSRLSWPRIR